MDVQRIQDYGRHFLNAFFADDDDGIELTEQLGAAEAILVLSSLLAIVTPELFGVPVVLEKVSQYAKVLSGEVGNYPRRIVLEGVLRAGAGNNWILDGLSEDEILEATGLVLRRTMQDLEEQSSSRATLVNRAVELAALQAPSESSK
jgi:hypothetical protein